MKDEKFIPMHIGKSFRVYSRKAFIARKCTFKSSLYISRLYDEGREVYPDAYREVLPGV